MRIWDLSPSVLCRQHLLGEHRELHCIWDIYARGNRGYSRHPETLRWAGKLGALRQRHDALVLEMEFRGYRHRSELPAGADEGSTVQDVLLAAPAEQAEMLRRKGCECRVGADGDKNERTARELMAALQDKGLVEA